MIGRTVIGRWLGGLAILLSFALIWWLFAPRSLGGITQFVVINGNSMAPLYQRGDLVITRVADDYAPGDIVTYRHPEIGLVIHRIIGQDDERWQLKGDHNDFVDPYEPLTTEIEGRAWLHIPRLGSGLVLARQYWWLIIVALAGGMVMAQPRATGRRRRPRHAIVQPVEVEMAAVTLCALGAIIAGMLAGYAFLQPASRVVNEPVVYRQHGIFTYLADAPPGVYDTEQAQTGDPVYFQLSSTLVVTFHYELPHVTTASGTIALNAEVSTTNGWRRRLALAPAQPFQGTEATVQGVINLADLRALIGQFEQQTGLSNPYYLLAITPDVAVNGKVDGLVFSDTFAPQLLFRFDKVQLTLVNPTDDRQGLAPRAEGRVARTRIEPAQLSLMFLSLEVQTARWWGMVIAGGLAVVFFAIGWPLWRRWQRDETLRIQFWYGNLIITGTAPHVDLPRVAVATMADLTRLAQRSGGLIIRDTSSEPSQYVFINDGTVYVYQAAESDSEAYLRFTPAPVEPCPPLVDWRDRFLTTLRETGLVSEACQAVGVDPFTAYRERSQNLAFAQAWREARQKHWEAATEQRGEA
ncbi:signal peptidase I [uncultured Chloroflexus sp.]|uniref:signal peptidase I n=1 Tax=uncultured Chloroflexus sp. TaxID=214040 RepID=UPI00260FF197|nr:signal peptidase I [uncultured Chloroflexus sp.]